LEVYKGGIMTVFLLIESLRDGYTANQELLEFPGTDA